MEKMKPCPFCGSMTHDIKPRDDIKDGHDWASLGCECGVVGPPFLTCEKGWEKDAAYLWNTRATDETIAKQAALIREMVDLLDRFDEALDLSRCHECWCADIKAEGFDHKCGACEAVDVASDFKVWRNMNCVSSEILRELGDGVI